MIAICPAGPPKLMKPSFSQKRSASANLIDPVDASIALSPRVAAELGRSAVLSCRESASRRGKKNISMPQEGQAGVPSAFDRDDLHIDAVEALEGVGTDDLSRRPQLEGPPFVEQQRALRADEGVVGIVAREQDRDAARGEAQNFFQNANLVAEVEARGRLVHHQQA